MKGFIEVHELEVDDRSLGIHCVKIIPVNRILEVYERDGLTFIIREHGDLDDGVIGDCVAESYEEVKKLIEEANT